MTRCYWSYPLHSRPAAREGTPSRAFGSRIRRVRSGRLAWWNLGSRRPRGQRAGTETGHSEPATRRSPMQRSTGAMVVAAAFVLAACGSTTLTDVWKAPDTARLPFTTVLVVALSTDITWRRTIEDELVRRIRDVQAVASYQFFADGEPREWEAARERLKAAGFDRLIPLPPGRARYDA